MPQDPNDEPVAKRYLNELGTTKLPENWRVLNFGKFCDIEGGNQPPKSQFIDEPREGYVQLFQIRDLGERGVPTYIPIASARSLSKEGDILIGRYGASVGKVFWAQNGAYNVAMAKFICPQDALVSNFAFLLLKSDFLQEPLAKATRSAQAGFNKGDLAAIDFPLPPLAEQRRIVAKFDELMGLCDRLEAARAGREAARDRLAAASLARLNKPNPKTFQDEARFVLDALPALTTRPDQIKELRNTILNLAVRGKLVPQDTKDEPALELLKLIAMEKARLVNAGEIRKGQPLPPIEADDLPFELPRGWAWSRLGDLIHLVSGQHLQPPEYSEDPRCGLPYITGPSDFAIEGLQISRFALVRKAVAKKGQLLLTVKGSGVGKTAICDIPEVAISRQLMALTAVEWDDRFLLLITHRLAEKLQAEARSLIPGISREDVDLFIIPLPPLAEQHRIVAKVDEVMGLCDRLEASLTATAATRHRLLDALLAEAQAPADDHELEAAE